MNLWIDRIEQALPDARVGRIQQSTYDVEDKDIVIGMLQTISMKDFSLIDFDCFGHVIIDEAHHLEDEVTRQFGLTISQRQFSEIYDKIRLPFSYR